MEVPRSVNHALQLDKKNGNTLWEDAIKTELKMLEKYNTFRLRTEGESLEEYLKIPYHFVFDVKYDLHCRARLVAGGNHTEALRNTSSLVW